MFPGEQLPVPGAARAEWRRGWGVVLAAAAGAILCSIHLGAIGTLIVPLSHEYGWSRATVTVSITIVTTAMMLVGPVVGMIVDRFGPRAVALVGVPLFSFALAAVGLSGGSTTGWYLSWFLVALTYPAISMIIWTMGVGQCFVQSRGLALALALTGGGLGNVISPLIAVAVLPVFGWRGVFGALGAVSLLLAWPLVWLLFRPGSVALNREAAAPAAAPVTLTGYAREEILCDRRFWSLALAVALAATGIGMLMLHFQPILADRGVSPVTAAQFAASIGIIQVLSRTVGGYLLDRFPSRIVAAVCVVGAAIAGTALLAGGGTPAAIVATVGIGFAVGVEADIVAYVAAQYFGLRHYGLTFAILFGLYSGAFGFAPLAASFVYDLTGSYLLVFQAVIAAMAISAVLFLSIGRPLPLPMGESQNMQELPI